MVNEGGSIVAGTQPKNIDTAKPVKTKEYADYIPHPAFEFDNTSKAGIWLGKFESSGTVDNVQILTCKKTLQIRVPLVFNDLYEAAKNVKASYNLNSDSHMMKNIEWGASTYLQNSKYGRNGTKVTRNNVSTGYGYDGTNGTITGGGNFEENPLQSTTGNVYGVYDMNGGLFELVAGYVDHEDAKTNTYISKMYDDGKYADIYENGKKGKGMVGDSIYETSTIGNVTRPVSWEKSEATFPALEPFNKEIRPIFIRGKYSIYEFGQAHGGNGGTGYFYTLRIVLID